MPIRFEAEWFTPAMCLASPDALFVYGDNLARWGKGGQAAIRDEPNAVGIPTKKAPGMHPVDFFKDRDLEAYRKAREPDLARLIRHLSKGGEVVLPADGLGTGRARLQQSAPAIWAELQDDMNSLRAVVVALAVMEKWPANQNDAA